MASVWILAEISGPETMIDSVHASRKSAVARKRHLIDAYPLPKHRQRYGDSLVITEWAVTA